MALYYKKLKQYQNIIYDWTQNQGNSRLSFILAHDARDKTYIDTVATINNKRGTVKYHDEELVVPDKMKEEIRWFVDNVLMT